jgi:hypothetical protein
MKQETNRRVRPSKSQDLLSCEGEFPPVVTRQNPYFHIRAPIRVAWIQKGNRNSLIVHFRSDLHFRVKFDLSAPYNLAKSERREDEDLIEPMSTEFLRIRSYGY